MPVPLPPWSENAAAPWALPNPRRISGGGVAVAVFGKEGWWEEEEVVASRAPSLSSPSSSPSIDSPTWAVFFFAER